MPSKNSKKERSDRPFDLRIERLRADKINKL